MVSSSIISSSSRIRSRSRSSSSSRSRRRRRRWSVVVLLAAVVEVEVEVKVEVVVVVVVHAGQEDLGSNRLNCLPADAACDGCFASRHEEAHQTPCMLVSCFQMSSRHWGVRLIRKMPL